MISSYLKSALTFHLSSSTIIIMDANYSLKKKHDNKRTGSATVVLIISRWTVIDNFFFVFVWGLGASVGMYVCVQVISVQYPRS